jgi:hypothetical protein
MASTDANNNSQWWTWGVNNNIWTIQPNWTFSGSTGFFIDPTGKVGIGTQSPQYTLDVNGSARITGSLILPSYTDSVFHTGNTNTNLTTYFNNAASQGYPAWDTFSLGANWNDGAGTVVNNQEGTALFQMRTNYGGTNSTNGAMITLGVGSVNSSPTTMVETITTTGVGIGTTNPGANYKLDVAGQVHSSAGFVFPDGSLQTTAYTGTCGADYAESVDVTGDRTKYAPGDILVIDPDAPGSFLKSNQPYSTMVAGVYSTQPGFVGRKHPANDPASVNEIPMAMVGRVPTRVSAENGPIKIGDLLVTSSTVGYAMKGTDRSQMLGAVIGKALGSLDSGTGVIEVLITLQ